MNVCSVPKYLVVAPSRRENLYGFMGIYEARASEHVPAHLYLICSLAPISPISHLTILRQHLHYTSDRHQPLLIFETQREIWETLFSSTAYLKACFLATPSRILPPLPSPSALLNAPLRCRCRRSPYSFSCRHSDVWLPQPCSPIRTSLVYRAFCPYSVDATAGRLTYQFCLGTTCLIDPKVHNNPKGSPCVPTPTPAILSRQSLQSSSDSASSASTKPEIPACRLIYYMGKVIYLLI